MASPADARVVCLAVAALAAHVPVAHAGDVVRGMRVFDRCYACHSVDARETGLPGPNLAGVIGRGAASLADFDYSDALRAKARDGLAWTVATLEAYVRDPEAFVPGGRMGGVRLRDARDIADLIAFLQAAR